MAEQAAAEVIALPIDPEMTGAQPEEVAAALRLPATQTHLSPAV